MNIFAWLIIGHLVGDWLLQSDWMAQGKKKGLVCLAGQVHFAIYATAIVAALWLSGVRDKQPAFYLLLGAIVFCSHWLLDSTQIVERWMRRMGQHNPKMVRLMVDQTLHLIVLAALAVLV